MWWPCLDAWRNLIWFGISLLAPPFVWNVQCCNIWSHQIHTRERWVLSYAKAYLTLTTVQSVSAGSSSGAVCIWRDQILQHCTFRTNGGASRETPDRMSFLPASSHGCHMFGVVRTGAAASMRRGGGVARRGTRRGSRRGSRHGTRRGTRRAAGEWRTCMPECRSALYGGAHGKPVPVPQNAAYAAPRRTAGTTHIRSFSLSLSNAGSLHHTRDDS